MVTHGEEEKEDEEGGPDILSDEDDVHCRFDRFRRAE
jgi:hypothetical protein